MGKQEQLEAEIERLYTLLEMAVDLTPLLFAAIQARDEAQVTAAMANYEGKRKAMLIMLREERDRLKQATST